MTAANNEVMTDGEAAKFRRVAIRTQQRERQDGVGPPFIRLSARRVGYLRSDIVAWLGSRRFASTSEETVARGSGKQRATSR